MDLHINSFLILISSTYIRTYIYTWYIYMYVCMHVCVYVCMWTVRIRYVTMQIGSEKRGDVFFFRRQCMWTIWSLTLIDHRHPVFRSDLIAQCVLYAVRYAGRHLDWKSRWLCTKRVFLMRIQSTLLRLWLLCAMSVIVLVNQLPAFRATWGHMRGYLMRNMKLETAIICGDAAIIRYVNTYPHRIGKDVTQRQFWIFFS